MLLREPCVLGHERHRPVSGIVVETRLEPLVGKGSRPIQADVSVQSHPRHLVLRWLNEGELTPERPPQRVSSEGSFNVPSRADAINVLLSFVKWTTRSRDDYRLGDFIYRLRTNEPVRLPQSVTAVLPGCRVGRLMHSDIYGTDPEKLKLALNQLLSLSHHIVIDIRRRGASESDRFDVIVG